MASETLTCLESSNQHDRKLLKLKRGIDDDCIVVAAMGGLIIITWLNFPLMMLFSPIFDYFFQALKKWREQ